MLTGGRSFFAQPGSSTGFTGAKTARLEPLEAARGSRIGSGGNPYNQGNSRHRFRGESLDVCRCAPVDTGLGHNLSAG